MIAGEIGLTFGTVYHQGVNLGTWRRREFYVCWKSRAAHPDDSGFADAPVHGVTVERGKLQLLSLPTVGFRLLAIDGDLDVVTQPAAGKRPLDYSFDFAVNGRMYVGGNHSRRLGDQLARENGFSLRLQNLGRSAEMLQKRNLYDFRNR